MHIRDIQADNAQRKLRLVMEDGEIRKIDMRTLRQACRCAECSAARRRGEALPLEDDITLTNMKAIGEHGLQIFFSDGHQRGIYPLSYLSELA